MALRIGIDFDNTIIDYSELFSRLASELGWTPVGAAASKQSLKAQLIREDSHDLRWQKLQALAYGERITGARIYEGFVDFLRLAAELGCEVHIISHKSEASHLDPSVKLRKWALEWLESQGLFQSPDRPHGVPRGNVHFESTQEGKVRKIRELGCALFIDDLAEVLEREDFPPATVRVLFSPSSAGIGENSYAVASSWKGLEELLRLFSECGPQLWASAEKRLGSALEQGALLRRTGNNRVYKLSSRDGGAVVLKKYHPPLGSLPDREAIEFSALSLLWKNGLRCVPEPIEEDRAHSSALYSFIEGKVLSGTEISADHLAQAARFLVSLQELGSSRDFPEVSPAVDSRFSLQEYLNIVQRRWDQVQAGAQTHQESGEFFRTRLAPIRDTILARFHLATASEDLRAPLSKAERILSPSDFGFHNALCDSKGKLTFVDFEYFGWDDPAKLIADFFHSVGQNLSWDQKWAYFDEFKKGHPRPEAFQKRWETVVDLIGLEWILIVLNVLSPEVMARKKFANPGLDVASLLSERLSRARAMSEFIEKRIRENARFLTIMPRAKT